MQTALQRVFNQSIDIGALARANTQRLGDWDDLFETNLPFLEPSDEEIAEVETLLNRLRNW